MKFTQTTIIALALISCTTTAYAQDKGLYGGIGATTYDFDNYGVDLKLGYNFNKNFGIEAQGIIGLTTDSTPVSGLPNAATFKQEVDYTLGAFAVARLPISQQFDVFARAGIHNTKDSAELNNVFNSMFNNDEVGFAGGGGVQYNLNSKSALRLEFTYLDESDFSATSIGYVRKF